MKVAVSILFSVFAQFWGCALSTTITLEECRSPDYPLHGGYGPVKEKYTPGDVITIFCNTGTFLGGNLERKCMDTGGWSGYTPMCDTDSDWSRVEQSSTQEPISENSADRAVDGDRTTCSKTLGERNGAVWTGYLSDVPAEAVRFYIFAPLGDAAYQIFIVKANGAEISCEVRREKVEMHDWKLHYCLNVDKTGVVAVRVKSLNGKPLEICELKFHTLTEPSCFDPNVRIDNGRLIVSRKTAILRCDDQYVKWDESESMLRCMRNQVWSVRNLVCVERAQSPRQQLPPASGQSENEDEYENEDP